MGPGSWAPPPLAFFAGASPVPPTRLDLSRARGRAPLPPRASGPLAALDRGEGCPLEGGGRLDPAASLGGQIWASWTADGGTGRRACAHASNQQPFSGGSDRRRSDLVGTRGLPCYATDRPKVQRPCDARLWSPCPHRPLSSGSGGHHLLLGQLH